MIIIKELISALISVTCFDTSKHRSKLRFIARSSVSTSNNTVQPGGRQRPAWVSQASEVQRLTPPRCGRRLLEVQPWSSTCEFNPAWCGQRLLGVQRLTPEPPWPNKNRSGACEKGRGKSEGICHLISSITLQCRVRFNMKNPR